MLASPVLAESVAAAGAGTAVAVAAVADATAVLTASQLGFASGRLDRLAMAWVVLRVAYIAVYCAGLAKLRSLIWAVAMAVALAIFTLPAWG